MSGVSALRAARIVRAARLSSLSFSSALLVALLAAAPPVAAFEAFDGRFQAHGFYESQLRMLSEDFTDQWDVAQWYQVFNIELEAEIVQDTVGILDLVSAYVRVEGRYDCVYSRGCGMFRSINSFGDRSKSLPLRLRDARLRTTNGGVTVPRTTDVLIVEDQAGRPFETLVDDDNDFDRRSGQMHRPVGLDLVSGFSTLAGSKGADGLFGRPDLDSGCPLAQLFAGGDGVACGKLAGGQVHLAEPDGLIDDPNGIDPSELVILNNDDPFRYVFERQLGFRFTQIQGKGGDEGLPTTVLGPWLPRNKIETIAATADRINPMDPDEASPVLKAAVFNTEITGGGELLPGVNNVGKVFHALQVANDISKTHGVGANPFRPVPLAAPGGAGVGSATARGMYYPSAPLRRLINSGDLDSFDFNFNETERAFNRGASQQDEGELKEAYLDIELFDSRLWLRVGKQSIVWGKTELFRTTDQFNPQDLALASLPSLEESRIPLWAFRAVYSLYEVGPLEDVRVEVAFNFDDYEPADLGACGEAFTPNVVCQLTFGAFAHGTAGLGIVGVDRPPDPWDSLSGWEIGGRLEFRWDRFSFAISDFYGYSDFPTLKRISTYERNVDPNTGRPRIIAARGPCTDGTQASCLTAGPTSRSDAPGEDDSNALDFHHANQQLFTMICATTIGFSSLDPTACAQTVFGSTAKPPATAGFFSISQLISSVLAGSGNSRAANNAIASTLPASILMPLVKLSQDANDLSNAGTGCVDGSQPNPFIPGLPAPECGSGGAGNISFQNDALGQYLTPEQEALLGCGPFWGTSCDDSGVDLLNMEASAMLQSFVGFEGTVEGWRTDDRTRPQPGTVGFVGGPVCSFGNLLANPNAAVVGQRLPGCRGPGDSGYSVAVDGDPGQTLISVLQNAAPAGVLIDPADPNSRGKHPFTGQAWQNEMAALSWNFQMLLVTQSEQFVAQLSEEVDAGPSGLLARVQARAYSTAPNECSFIQPQFCDTPQSIFSIVGVQRNIVQAGGNGRFGRRTFVYHGGGEAVVTYDKRNVLGFSMDFAEDVTKTNWGVESTWIEGVPLTNNDRYSGVSRVQEFNLTISVDRPTFINFLNANRTFFITSQWFFRYQSGFESGHTANGPLNILGLLLISTGYYQDRLLPNLILVWDVKSRSGAALPSVTYRYNEDFSVTVGAAFFNGRQQLRDMPINPLGTPSNELGRNAYRVGVENGLAVVRDRDEIFMKLRYTF